ncbi:MAG: lysophospholipid acyltransferase family protein [Melioribacteraceae bacterium]|nr:lysophospholipid acyltransferase family protein [Melioribacteraceae bacterium]
MLKAQHNFLAQKIFYPYLERLLKKNFSHFYFTNELPQIDKNLGLIITPNHFSWWDGFFIGYVERKFIKRKIHIMMLEEQLRKYWFFQKVGAYSINPNNSKSIIETSNYTSQLITNENVVVIYPQGNIEPFDPEQINIKKGLQLFTKKTKDNFMVLPVAFKIQFYEEKKPAIITRFGNYLDGKIINENYELYINEFIKNVSLLNELSNKKLFIKNIFEEN